MIASVAEFAHLASTASKERAGFEATQLIEGAGMRIEATVGRLGPRSIHVEYRTYRNPWTELEETLYGHVEFVEDDLCGSSLHWDGQATWVHDPSTDTCIRKIGRQLSEPIPGVSMLCELSFLDTLAQDFLLRDLGEDRLDARVVRRIALKPKQTYRSHLLSAVTFPIDKATIDFDTETLFPVSVSFVPSLGSPAASLLGSDTAIRISYKDVRIQEGSRQSNPFQPPTAGRVFEESHRSALDLADLLPFSVSLPLLLDHGFDTADGSALLSMDAENARAFATATFLSKDDSSDERTVSPRLTLTLGNYVSRNMARRRITLSEMGQPRSRNSLSFTVLARSGLWEQRLPGIDTQHAPVEAFFESGGVLWFLSGIGMELDSMEALAGDLLEAQVETAA